MATPKAKKNNKSDKDTKADKDNKSDNELSEEKKEAYNNAYVSLGDWQSAPTLIDGIEVQLTPATKTKPNSLRMLMKIAKVGSWKGFGIGSYEQLEEFVETITTLKDDILKEGKDLFNFVDTYIIKKTKKKPVLQIRESLI